MKNNKGKNNLPKRKATRLKGHNYTSQHIYFITTCTHSHKQIFKNNSAAQNALRNVFESAKKTSIEILVVCIMPDHIHFLLRPIGQFSTDDFMRNFKGKTAHLLIKSGFKSPVWQRSYYDHIVRKEENINELISYILYNPVRKELVDSFEKYPWSWDAFNIIESTKRQREE